MYFAVVTLYVAVPSSFIITGWHLTVLKATLFTLLINSRAVDVVQLSILLTL